MHYIYLWNMVYISLLINIHLYQIITKFILSVYYVIICLFNQVYTHSIDEGLVLWYILHVLAFFIFLGY